jgi:hypothetical protein
MANPDTSWPPKPAQLAPTTIPQAIPQPKTCGTTDPAAFGSCAAVFAPVVTAIKAEPQQHVSMQHVTSAQLQAPAGRTCVTTAVETPAASSPAQVPADISTAQHSMNVTDTALPAQLVLASTTGQPVELTDAAVTAGPAAAAVTDTPAAAAAAVTGAIASAAATAAMQIAGMLPQELLTPGSLDASSRQGSTNIAAASAAVASVATGTTGTTTGTTTATEATDNTEPNTDDLATEDAADVTVQEAAEAAAAGTAAAVSAAAAMAAAVAYAGHGSHVCLVSCCLATSSCLLVRCYFRH